MVGELGPLPYCCYLILKNIGYYFFQFVCFFVLILSIHFFFSLDDLETKGWVLTALTKLVAQTGLWPAAVATRVTRFLSSISVDLQEVIPSKCCYSGCYSGCSPHLFVKDCLTLRSGPTSF